MLKMTFVLRFSNWQPFVDVWQLIFCSNEIRLVAVVVVAWNCYPALGDVVRVNEWAYTVSYFDNRHWGLHPVSHKQTMLISFKQEANLSLTLTKMIYLNKLDNTLTIRTESLIKYLLA